MGYAIQAGAFQEVENAARLANRLNEDNMDATISSTKGIVQGALRQFSNPGTCRAEAEILKAMGVIGEYYIVRPERVCHREEAAP
jgi:cell division septation protein DedD